jgi:hypothetical protein
VDERPFFPPPRPRGEPYREPAPVPAVTEVAAPAQPRKAIVFVTRPEPQPDETPPRRVPAAPNLFAKERSYWDRYGTFTRFPRVFGALLVALGGSVTWSSVDTLLHGGFYGRRSAVLGPVALATGLWPLIFGMPRDGGHPPPWWTLGYVTCAVLGFAIGLGLLYLLESSRAG